MSGISESLRMSRQSGPSSPFVFDALTFLRASDSRASPIRS